MKNKGILKIVAMGCYTFLIALLLCLAAFTDLKVDNSLLVGFISGITVFFGFAFGIIWHQNGEDNLPKVE